MLNLGRNELLSLLDRDHVYRSQMDRLDFPRLVTYLCLLHLYLPEDGQGTMPLRILINYFNNSVQISIRMELERIGLIAIGHEKKTSPSQIKLLSVVLSRRYAREGPGPPILMEKDKAYLALLRGIDMKAVERKRIATGQVRQEPLPRKWCRAYMLDLLYRGYSKDHPLQGQQVLERSLSRITQWRGRKRLVAIGRIRREWQHIAGPIHRLKVIMEPIPASNVLAKPHPYDKNRPRFN